MQALLLLTSLTEYQAACLSPWLWGLVILAGLRLWAGWKYDRDQKARRKKQAKELRRPRCTREEKRRSA